MDTGCAVSRRLESEGTSASEGEVNRYHPTLGLFSSRPTSRSSLTSKGRSGGVSVGLGPGSFVTWNVKLYSRNDTPVGLWFETHTVV